MKKEFLALDTDGNGDISVQELDTLLKSLKRKLRMSENEIKKLVKDTDKNGDGVVDMEEFFSMVECGDKQSVIRKEMIQRSGVRKCFQKYDRDGSGSISREEFRKVVEDKYQSTLRSTQIDSLMEQADKDNSGQISYEEFLMTFSYFPVTK
jgi:Ca2+-binding EF-hand superfamily protein